MKTRRWWHALTLLPCLMLNGCVFLTFHDLHIVEAKAVGIVGHQRMDGDWLVPDFPATMVAVEFSTDRNLSAYSRASEYSTYLLVSPCNKGAFDPARQLAADPFPFTKNGELGLRPEGPGDGRHFRLYFDTAWNPPVRPREQATYRYDLVAQPEDICFQLGGGNMLGGGFRSNVVVLSKAVLADLFAKAGLP
jgi:hypothetical protein